MVLVVAQTDNKGGRKGARAAIGVCSSEQTRVVSLLKVGLSGKGLPNQCDRASINSSSSQSILKVNTKGKKHLVDR